MDIEDPDALPRMDPTLLKPEGSIATSTMR